MDVREKLVEILKQAPFEGKVLDEWWWEEKIKRIADHLISNGVTVQEWISVKDHTPTEASMNNADKIRSMSDEELAAWIAGMSTICECCAELNECESPRDFNRCSHGVDDWLKQPAE